MSPIRCHIPTCCLAPGHQGPHLHKCHGAFCPGYPWPASVMAHPNGCARIAIRRPRNDDDRPVWEALGEAFSRRGWFSDTHPEITPESADLLAIERTVEDLVAECSPAFLVMHNGSLAVSRPSMDPPTASIVEVFTPPAPPALFWTISETPLELCDDDPRFESLQEAEEAARALSLEDRQPIVGVRDGLTGDVIRLVCDGRIYG